MYLLSYFKEDSESLFLAESTDGLNWTERNNGRPVFASSVGTRQIRDPFLIQDQSGRFHALWPDGWSSRSIGYASSADLIHWEDERLIPVMEHMPDTQNTWAPEAFYDKVHNLYRILWSSTVAPGPRNHRIWSAATPDFRAFGEASLFFDPGYNVIDATVTDVDGNLLLLFKDERGHNAPGTDYKAIRSCSLTIGPEGAAFGPESEALTPPLTEGPTLYKLPEGSPLPWKWMMLTDGFHEGYYAAFGSADLKKWERVPREGCRLPDRIRHASVITVTVQDQ